MNDVVSAFMLLTRLPVAPLAGLGGPPDLARCVWAFPLVGLVVNGLGSLVYWLAHSAGMSPLLAAAWSMAATTIVTGALHEDGLADTADGWGGGATRARKLEIMRDSRIGTYGVLALLLSMTLRVAAIAQLGRPVNVATALIVAGMLGRGGMLVMIMPLAPARSDGMGHALGGLECPSGKSRTDTKSRSAWLGLALATAAAFACLSPQTAFAAIALGFGASLVFARLAYTQIGGFTGDVLGAGEVVTECIVLTTVAWALSG